MGGSFELKGSLHEAAPACLSSIHRIQTPIQRVELHEVQSLAPARGSVR